MVEILEGIGCLLGGSVEQPLCNCSLQRVVGQYDLGELRSVHRLAKGYVNENWALETTRGRYFLKRRHPDLRNPGVISAQHALMQYLRESGLPVPAVLEHVGGTTFLVLDGEFYEIHEYIEGESYDHANGAHFRAAAIFLRLYHSYVQGLELEDLCFSCHPYSPSILRANLANIREAWKLDENSALTRTWHQLTAQADALAEYFPRPEKLPHVIIHGDYHGDNLLFKNDLIVGVVDYDKARWQPRVVELAEALIYFASARPGHLKHVVYPGFVNWAKFSSFLRYYCSEACANARRSGSIGTFSKPNVRTDELRSAQLHVLRDSEIFALSAFIRCIWLSISLQRLLEKDVGHVRAREALQEVLELGQWGAKNTERMIENTYAALKGY